MAGSSLLFSLMGVLVKACSANVPAGEMVFWRSAVGALFIASWVGLRGGTLATRVPARNAVMPACLGASGSVRQMISPSPA